MKVKFGKSNKINSIDLQSKRIYIVIQLTLENESICKTQKYKIPTSSMGENLVILDFICKP